jgi:hypothetical protein
MDNYHIDITSEGKETLAAALTIALRHAAGGAAEGFRVLPPLKKGEPPTLLLYWHVPDDQRKDPVQRFGFKMKFDALLAFIREWLSQQDYGPEPDHDGSNGKGWRVYNEAWTHVAGDNYAFLGVQPSWAWYGK